MGENRLSFLFYKVLDGTATEVEKLEFAELSLQPGNAAELESLLQEGWDTFPQQGNAFDERHRLVLNKIINKDFQVQPAGTAVHRIHLLRRTWFRYAAAILLMIGIGSVAYLLTTNGRPLPDVANRKGASSTDVAPGGDRATLVLGDGRTILLDSASDGNIANEGGVDIVKLSNGNIAYDVPSVTQSEVFWNTMNTPIGGQYRLTLADGTRVWLNAASSITFPTAFTGNMRQVKISGEAYLEVAKNKAQPFFVQVDGSSIEVLGTSFNVNAYKDDGNLKTTLLEGSVKIVAGTRQTILQPGSQAIVPAIVMQEGQIKIQPADLEQTLAWKNGLFNFNGLELRVVMRQLERWYGVKVKYEGSVPELIFRGKMYRTANLSEALEIFEQLGIKFRLEGKTLFVTG